MVEAVEPEKKKRVRKPPAEAAPLEASPLDAAAGGSAPAAAAAEADAPAKPNRKTAKKATPVASDDEGAAG